MGQSLILHRMPAGGRLYARVAGDPQAGAVFAHLLMHGGHPGDWQHDRTGDLGEILDDLATWELLGSRAVVDRALDDLIADLGAEQAGSAEAADRWAFLGKTQHDIERGLAGGLRRRGHPDPDGFARVVVFGADHLAPAGMAAAPGMGLRATPPGVVRATDEWLDAMPSGLVLDPEREAWVRQDYLGLRRLMHAAAARGEAVLVGSEFTRPPRPKP